MKLDGPRVQTRAAELSGSRCPGCCQRLGAGKEPADGDGDRVAERGGSWEPAGTGPGSRVGGYSTKRSLSDQDQPVMGAQRGEG